VALIFSDELEVRRADPDESSELLRHLRAIGMPTEALLQNPQSERLSSFEQKLEFSVRGVEGMGPNLTYKADLLIARFCEGDRVV
jgi:hypothetical protein